RRRSVLLPLGVGSPEPAHPLDGRAAHVGLRPLPDRRAARSWARAPSGASEALPRSPASAHLRRHAGRRAPLHVEEAAAVSRRRRVVLALGARSLRLSARDSGARRSEAREPPPEENRRRSRAAPDRLGPNRLGDRRRRPGGVPAGLPVRLPRAASLAGAHT